MVYSKRLINKTLCPVHCASVHLQYTTVYVDFRSIFTWAAGNECFFYRVYCTGWLCFMIMQNLHLFRACFCSVCFGQVYQMFTVCTFREICPDQCSLRNWLRIITVITVGSWAMMGLSRVMDFNSWGFYLFFCEIFSEMFMNSETKINFHWFFTSKLPDNLFNTDAINEDVIIL